MIYGTLPDLALLVLMLHTGVRAKEFCHLQRSNVTMRKRSDQLAIYGKGNKYREVPLNGTARVVLAEYLSALPYDDPWLFESNKQKTLASEPTSMPP